MLATRLRLAVHAIRHAQVWARLGRSMRSERGVSLPEILVATVIAASVVGLLGTSVYQFFRATSDGRDHLGVQNSLRNAALWLGRDASEAQSFTAGSGPTYGTLNTGDPSIKYRYTYDPGQKTLVRVALLDDVPQTTQAIARNIEAQGDVTFSVNGGLLTVTLTATSPDGSVSQDMTLNLAMRVR